MNFQEALRKAEQSPDFQALSGPEKWQAITKGLQLGKFSVDPAEKQLFVSTQKRYTTPIKSVKDNTPTFKDVALEGGKDVLRAGRDVAAGAFNNAAKIATSPAGMALNPPLASMIKGADSLYRLKTGDTSAPAVSSKDFKNESLGEQVGGAVHDSALMSAGGPITNAGGRLASLAKSSGLSNKVLTGILRILDDAVGGAASTTAVDAAKGESLEDIKSNAGTSAIASGALGAAGRGFAAGSKKAFTKIHQELEPSLKKAFDERVVPRMFPDEVPAKAPNFRQGHIDSANMVVTGDDAIARGITKTGKYTSRDDVEKDMLELIKDKLKILPNEGKRTIHADPHSPSSYPEAEQSIFNRIQKALNFLEPLPAKNREVIDLPSGMVLKTIPVPIMRKVGGVMQDVTGYTDPRNVHKVLSSMRAKSAKDVADIGAGPVAKLQGIFQKKLMNHIDDALTAPGISPKDIENLENLKNTLEITHDEALAKVLYEKIGKFSNSTLRAKSLSAAQADLGSPRGTVASAIAGFGSTPFILGHHYGRQTGKGGKHLANIKKSFENKEDK